MTPPPIANPTTNPITISLFAAAFAGTSALGAVMTACFNWYFNRRSMRQRAWDTLSQKISLTNSRLVDLGLVQPVGNEIKRLEYLPIDYNYSRYSEGFFHQVNLYFNAYLNKDVLTKDEIANFHKWMKTVVLPWAYRFEDLQSDYAHMTGGLDLYPREFIQWLIAVREQRTVHGGLLKKPVALSIKEV